MKTSNSSSSAAGTFRPSTEQNKKSTVASVLDKKMELRNSYIFLSESKVHITPVRFWKWFDEDNFVVDQERLIAHGNFGIVKSVTFQSLEYLAHRKQISIYANQRVALKEPKGEILNFIDDQYSLSLEINCTVILHPNIINYIGGVQISRDSTDKIAILMELMDTNLRNCIGKDPRLEIRTYQFSILKQISSGMNFLHSQTPYVLHRDLRTPNILVNRKNLECKITDFQFSTNVVYDDYKPLIVFSSLVPPECSADFRNFTPKGDVYFFGWIAVEILLGYESTTYQLKDIVNEIEIKADPTFTSLIFNCLDPDPQVRKTFNQINDQLNFLLNVKYDLESIAQNNSVKLLQEGIKNKSITPNTVDALERNLAHQCAIFGNLEMMEKLLKLWGEKILKSRDKYGITLTHLAARNGHLHILKFLDSKKCLDNGKELRFQISGLDLAIAMKHSEAVKFMLPKMNQINLDSALLSASQEGNLELVKQLVLVGANLECRMVDVGATPLDRAAYNGHYSVVFYLLEQGALVNQITFDNRTPLWNASQNGHLEIVRLLIEKGANTNTARVTDGCTPLFVACQKGNIDVVKLLLENGSQPNIRCTDDGSPPLFIVVQDGNVELLKILLQAGADPNQSRSSDGISALFLAVQASHLEVVDILLKAGALINFSRPSDGCTCLFLASHKGYYFMVKKLLENGANPNITTNNGNSSLIIAAFNGFDDIVELLLQYGANKNQTFFGMNALAYATNRGHDTVVEILGQNKKYF